ncbi:Zinc fingerC2H2 [Penicillium lividum]|nr:Zinc fingerC2H2 [Penicillium lividum]
MKKYRKFEFSKAITTTLKEYIKGELKVKIGLSIVGMNGGGVSLNDLILLMTQFWCRDYHEYRGNPADRT